MAIVNMLEAKSSLSKLVQAAERGEEVIIARNGKPVARIVPVLAVGDEPQRLGAAEGQWEFDYEAFQALDEEIARLFTEGPLFPDEAAPPPQDRRRRRIP